MAGPKDNEATVELGGGMVLTVLEDDRSLGLEVGCLLCDISSVGDAGAVDRIASGATVAGGFT